MFRLSCLIALFMWSVTCLAGSPPNIILVLVDDMGWEDPGFMGNTWHETPAMDRLAASGTVFTDAYAAAPNCKPGRASLLTGLYPPRHRVYSALPSDPFLLDEQRLVPPPARFRLHPGIATVASRLKAAGYATALVGKWDLGDGDAAPQAFGFDENIGGFRGGMLEQGFFAPWHLPGLEDGPKGEYLTDRLGAESERFIRAHAGKPFFLFLSQYAVHVPLQAPAQTVAHFQAKPAQGIHNAEYAAMLRHIDDSIGRIAATLDALGIADNTLIVLTSDNGGVRQFAPTSLRGEKGSLYEGGLRVPLLVHWPAGHVLAQRIMAPTHAVDIAPTLLAAAGIDSTGMDGTNLLPCLQAAQCDAGRSLFWYFPVYVADYRAPDGFFMTRPTSVIRQGPWKLLHDIETGSLQLYNLRDDPAETHDLAAQDPARANALDAQLQNWLAASHAEMPSPNPDWHALHGIGKLWFQLRVYWHRWVTHLFTPSAGD